MGSPLDKLVTSAVVVAKAKGVSAAERRRAELEAEGRPIREANQKAAVASDSLREAEKLPGKIFAAQEAYEEALDLFTAQQQAIEGPIDDAFVEFFEVDTTTVSLSKKDQGRLWSIAAATAAKINEQRLAAAKKQQVLEQKALDEQFARALAEAEAEVKKFEEDAAARRLESGLSPVEEFFAPQNNSIVRSFRSAGGRGLAGVIDSMNFEWLDNQNITWETDTGKAPMLCKVTIQFSPIHDISPGLDSQGYNRAPVYPVGNFAPSVEELDTGPED